MRVHYCNHCMLTPMYAVLRNQSQKQRLTCLRRAASLILHHTSTLSSEYYRVALLLVAVHSSRVSRASYEVLTPTVLVKWGWGILVTRYSTPTS
jgi:hypothetical protein